MMKSFLACLCLIFASYSTWVTTRWWPGPPEFTNILEQKASPDGLIIASSVVENYGGWTGTTFGLTLSSRKQDPLKSDAILTEGEDDTTIQYDWITNDRLEVRLPCGWWGSLTNHYQLRGTDRVVAIFYLPPSPECSHRKSGSTALPN